MTKQLNQKSKREILLNIRLIQSTFQGTQSFFESNPAYFPFRQTLMIAKDKRKQSKNKNHFKAPYEDDQENLLVDVLSLLDNLFEIRLIQKIARPLDRKNKQQLLIVYGQKLELLHSKLTKIRTQIVENNTVSETGGEKRNKSVFGEATTKPDDWKKVIRNIENKYSEILIDGSFKHYKKIILLLGLNTNFNMDLMNIEEWAAACLDNRANGNCC